MPPIHHQRLAEAAEAGLCWGCFRLLLGFRFLLVRLLFLLGIISPSLMSCVPSHSIHTGPSAEGHG